MILKIEDNGIGIDDYDINKIFDAYFKSDKLKEGKGDGIGLFIVKENLSKIGGYCSVDSELGLGTLLTINFPIEI